MNYMQKLQDKFSQQLHSIKETAADMRKIAHGEGWSVQAFRDFEKIEKELQKAGEIFEDTPNEPDDPDGESVWDDDEEDD